MICPYCGTEIVNKTQEHFFPQSVYRNQWDFWACKECNHLKRDHIVYPSSTLFKAYPSELSLVKFKQLWKLSAWDKYLGIVPHEMMRKIFDKGKWIYSTYTFTIQERKLYQLDRFKEIYEYMDSWINQDENMLAFIMAPDLHRMYAIHTYKHTPKVIYPEIKPLHIDDWHDTYAKGWLILGSAKYHLWERTTNYKEYFSNLLRAPSSMEMLERRW